MELTLKDCSPGDKAVIIAIKGEGPVRRRLMDMGVTRGTEVIVRKVAPMGDPIEVNIRGYELTFRKAEADNIVIQKR
ncbi:FeoA family protein [Paenibacillus sp. IHBB 10380]|uniref:FeoA family protein n=1 Tax=Paenibacillus sp. IHBB 10380 TaxID=1566358 RepID=UPI0005CFD7AD|nr:FeoA family protein [Paenibacillus sp. IHBB 10380]AJS59698.1 iron transporter FeoA [Paenibacillus sp. IHBB 10380]